MSIVSRLGLVLILAGLLAGCGGSPSAGLPSSSPSPSAAAPVDLTNPCTLLSAETVSGAFASFSLGKLKGVPKPPQTASNGLLTYFCEYRTEARDSGVGALAVVVAPGSVTPAQVAGRWMGLPNARQVSGVGDAAVYSNDPQKKIATFASAKTTSDGTVSVIFTSSAKTTQEMLAPLVKQAIDALPGTV